MKITIENAAHWALTLALAVIGGVLAFVLWAALDSGAR